VDIIVSSQSSLRRFEKGLKDEYRAVEES